jgi:hypothetical protein
MSFCTPKQNITKIFCKIFDQLPLLTIKNCFQVHSSPYYVETTSLKLNAQKQINFSNVKRNQKCQCQFWEFRENLLFSDRPPLLPVTTMRLLTWFFGRVCYFVWERFLYKMVCIASSQLGQITLPQNWSDGSKVKRVIFYRSIVF